MPVTAKASVYPDAHDGFSKRGRFPFLVYTAVLSRDGDIFDQVIIVFIEKQAGGEIHHHFTDEAFEPWRFEQGGQHKQRQQPPVSGNQL